MVKYTTAASVYIFVSYQFNKEYFIAMFCFLKTTYHKLFIFVIFLIDGRMVASLNIKQTSKLHNADLGKVSTI